VISLILGLIGFVMGLALRRRLVGTGQLGIGLLTGALVTAFVAVPLLELLRLYIPAGRLAGLPWLALCLGCAAAVSEFSVAEHGARLLRSSGPYTNLVRNISFAASLGALCTFGGVLAVARAGDASNRLGLTMTEWLVASLAVGAACGVLFHLFIGRSDDAQRTFLATVGVVTFASGLAAGMGVSPLLVNVVAGVTASLVSPAAAALAPSLERLERPAMIALLVFAGAMWQPVTGFTWLVPGLYLVLRYAALRAAPPLAVRMASDLTPAPRLGHALLAQGGLAVAIAVNLAQAQPQLGAAALTSVLLSLLLNDLWSAGALRRVLADVGEIRHDGLAHETAAGPGPSEGEA
jgi:hypothetical protein